MVINMPKLKNLGYSRLFREFPHLEDEWSSGNSLDPITLSRGSTKYALWICNLGHEYSARIDHRALSGSGCSICFGTTVLTGFNDLETDNQKLAVEWDYELNSKTPSEVHRGSSTKFWWKCSLNHSWDASVIKRNSGGQGCPYCKKGILLLGFNDLTTRNPDLALEWDYDKNTLKPSEVTVASNETVWWLCSMRHSWGAQISNRSLRGDGCPRCPTRGSSGAEVFLATSLENTLGINVQRSYRLDLPFRSRKYLHVDMYFEYAGLKICVEYDGMYWHREKQKIDVEKSASLLNAGYILFRIREGSSKDRRLGVLDMSHKDLHQLESIWDKNGVWSTQVSQRILEILERTYEIPTSY